MPIAVLFVASVIPLVIGGVLATTGHPFALQQRDAIVRTAQDSAITTAYRRGDHLEAALLDFAGNVQAAAVTSVTGLALVAPLPIVAYRGWVGGIVSIDADHRSRLREPGSALYFVVTVALQQIPFILGSASGMYLGIASWRRRNDPSVPSVLTLRIPGEAVRDVGWIWALALPLFLLGSLFEFLQ